MTATIIQILLIPFFILLNGFFAGAELALISARRNYLIEREQKGSRTARLALALKSSPEMFLPTVQVGITIVGSIASTIGGATLVGNLRDSLLPYVGPRFSQLLSILIVVGSISFLTLVIGELAPKNLALRYAEQYTLILARPMTLLQRAVWPLVRLLDWSTGLVLAPFGGKATSIDKVSREELRNVLFEAYHQGIYSNTERAMLIGAIEMVNRVVRDVTIPRHAVPTAAPSATLGELTEVIVNSQIPFAVLYDSRTDQVHGLLGWQAVFSGSPEEKAIRRSSRLIYVPETAPLPKAIEQLQLAGVQAGIVVNEYGEFEGLLSLTTLWQRQVMQFASLPGAHPGIKTLDGGWLVRGDTSVTALREQLALPLEDSVFYSTLGGFVLEAVGRLPVVGDSFSLYGYTFTVRAMQGYRVHEVEISRGGNGTDEKNETPE